MKVFSDHMETVHGKVDETTKVVTKKRKPGPASKTGRNVESHQTDDIYDKLKSEGSPPKKIKIGPASKTSRTKDESSISMESVGNRDNNESSDSDDESVRIDHGIPKDLLQSSDDDSEDDYELPFKLPFYKDEDDLESDNEQPPIMAQSMGSFVPLNKPRGDSSDESDSGEEFSPKKLGDLLSSVSNIIENGKPEGVKKRRPGPASRTGRSVNPYTKSSPVCIKRKPGPASKTGKGVQKNEILQEEITNPQYERQVNGHIREASGGEDNEYNGDSLAELGKETSDEKTTSAEVLEEGEVYDEDTKNLSLENEKIIENVVENKTLAESHPISSITKLETNDINRVERDEDVDDPLNITCDKEEEKEIAIEVKALKAKLKANKYPNPIQSNQFVTNSTPIEQLNPSPVFIQQNQTIEKGTSPMQPYEMTDKPTKLPKRSGPSKLTSTFDLDESTIRLSNDVADACETHCKLCNEAVKLVNMRNHTRRHHNGMTITEYKSQFGPEYEIIEKIYHKCGICEKIILLCSDSVSVHLKSHKGDDAISHRNYNEKYMTKQGKPYMTKKGNP